MRQLVLLAAALGISACGVASATAPDRTKLPLGDNKVSDSPKEGYAYSCQRADPNGGGAFTDGPWINGSTWDMTAKLHVQGSVSHDNVHKITVANGSRTIVSNGLPSTSGTFPISSSDPAYRYDRNPNSIQKQSISLSVPASPKRASTTTCIGGMVGITKTGIPIFSAFDATLRDANAHEIQDKCGGHPQRTGQYHYHGFSSCSKKTGLWGYALDGFGIYAPKDQQTGKTLSSKDLDACHGITSTVMWKGKWRRMYHYVATYDFPYTVGCFRGTPTNAQALG